MKKYFVYVKSHSEAPDFENYFTEEELKKSCPIPYLEDDTPIICGGNLKKTSTGFYCQACQQEFLEMEKINCQHQNQEFSEEIQDGRWVKGYRCQDCDEWIDKDYEVKEESYEEH